MKLNEMKITDIIPSEYNPRKITDEEYIKLSNSIQEFGFVDPIIINLKNNHIIGGHQRYNFLLNQYIQNNKYETLKLLKLGDIGWIFPETELTVENDDYEKALNIALNKISGEWDNEKLNELFQDLQLNEFDLDLTGFTNLELEEFHFEIAEEDILNDTTEIVDDEYVPEDDLTVTVERGDLYQLGKHYLMCGDSTNNEDVDKLMQGHKADISFTSPPYNAGTTPTETHMGISSKYKHDDDNKTTEEYTEFLNNYLSNAIKNSQYTFMNIQSLSNNKISLIETLYTNKKYFADTIIWDKMNGQPAMAKNVLNSVFEYIHIFSEKATRSIGTIEFRGTLENVIHMSLQRNNEYSKIHNATFSIEFASYFIKNFAKESVLDLFGGTGTTLIACEQLGKTCYMMEYDPYYCQVILDRYKQFTGNEVVKL
ncbi:MAG: DNA modification methylase [Methanobrevibacter sp.]|nr:DNA modification methylase [Methanobrevibacter sp.]